VTEELLGHFTRVRRLAACRAGNPAEHLFITTVRVSVSFSR